MYYHLWIPNYFNQTIKLSYHHFLNIVFLPYFLNFTMNYLLLLIIIKFLLKAQYGLHFIITILINQKHYQDFK